MLPTLLFSQNLPEPADSICGQYGYMVSGDRLVSREELRSISNIDILTALAMLSPQSPSFGEHAVWLVDGHRVPQSTIQTMRVHEIEAIRIIKSPAQLSMLGINGGGGAIDIITQKNGQGSLSATYHLDALAEHQMSNDTTEDDYRQTSLRHLHQLDVEGGDRYIGYKFTAQAAPQTNGTLKGSNGNDLGLRTYVSYLNGSLSLHNDISYKRGVDESAYPVEEHMLGSFDRRQRQVIADRFGLGLQLLEGLSLAADFSFVRQSDQRDLYRSPLSSAFADMKDVRQHGTYHILRQRTTTYEGGLALNYADHFYKHALAATAFARIYDGESEGDNFGGRGILSDRMSYVSFTQAYDTASPFEALRSVERTGRVGATVDYSFDSRYEATLTANWNRSSLLAADHKNAFYYGAGVLWNLHREPFLQSSVIKRLTVGAQTGTSGLVLFDDRQTNATYSNDIGNEYVYNYYQVGASLQGMPNSNLRPSRLTSNRLTADATISNSRTATIDIHLSLYSNRLSDLIAVEALPIATGFASRIANGGSQTERGADMCVGHRVKIGNMLQLNAKANANYNDGISSRWRGTLLLNADFKKMSFGAVLFAKSGAADNDMQQWAEGDDHLRLTSIYVAHTLPRFLKAIKDANVRLTGGNLARTRRCVASLMVRF